MYTLMQSVSLRTFLMTQMPALGGAFLIADTFYKFGSFGLECIAFLATWFALDAVVTMVGRLIGKSPD